MLIDCSEMSVALAAQRYLQPTLSSAVVIKGISKGNLAAGSHIRGMRGRGGAGGRATCICLGLITACLVRINMLAAGFDGPCSKQSPSWQRIEHDRPQTRHLTRLSCITLDSSFLKLRSD